MGSHVQMATRPKRESKSCTCGAGAEKASMEPNGVLGLVFRAHREGGRHRHSGRREDASPAAGNNVMMQERRKSVSHVEMRAVDVAAFLGVRVMAADMPELIQMHAFRCARRAHDGMRKFSSRQMALEIKKEFDKVYGPTWHCIVGTSFGSFVTHSTGCFIYFSMEKMLVMVFKTRLVVPKALT